MRFRVLTFILRFTARCCQAKRNCPFQDWGGRETRMTTREENALLTQTGPGTPGGELMRRYWHPIALSSELPPGGAPQPIRLFSEDLVLFRDDKGRAGLLGILCS